MKASKLDRILDQVPLPTLRAAIARRRGRALTDFRHKEFTTTLGKVAKKHRIPAERILSGRRDAPTCRARWALYLGLYDAGWCIGSISAVTGHEYTRITYCLRKFKRIPPAPRDLLKS